MDTSEHQHMKQNAWTPTKRRKRKKTDGNSPMDETALVESASVNRMRHNGDFTTSVGGIILPHVGTDRSSSVEGCMVEVPSTKCYLRSLALAVACKTPVLLRGPAGCGKTTLVEHLARLTGRREAPHLVKIQLGDQTDGKMLLGTYVCTNIPGEFVWQPGSLTQAVKCGHWILLEDVDDASPEVLTILLPLLESRTLHLHGHGGIVEAASDFRIFATQRTMDASGSACKRVPHFSISDKHWAKINIQPLAEDELEQVISTQWSCLRPIVKSMVKTYVMLRCGAEGTESGDDDNSVKQLLLRKGRPISMRDLMKWCRRSAYLFKSKSMPSISHLQNLMFQDAYDCFCCWIADRSSRLPVAVAIAEKFNVDKNMAELHCEKYKPSVNSSLDSFFSVGRSKLLCKPKNLTDVWSCGSTFSFTRPSLLLLERIMLAVQNAEPVLLVGETGTGKTSTVQYLAQQLGHKLVIVNMSQQSESSDLLGGYKPINMSVVVSPLRDHYVDIFSQTFSLKQNEKFLKEIELLFHNHNWEKMFSLMLHTRKAALKKKMNNSELLNDWKVFEEKVNELRIQIKQSALAFLFVEGTVTKAVREGKWLLLDEVNLAPSETLECLSGLLEGNNGSLLLLDKGELEPIKRHPDFHLFACMNPATDVGKKGLPIGIRNRFTEFFVDELEHENDLRFLVSDYLKGLSLPALKVNHIVAFYLNVKNHSINHLADGLGHKPHFSLRTFCRALTYASLDPCRSIPRSLYEAFCLSFLTQLDQVSHNKMQRLIVEYILKGQNRSGLLQEPLPRPTSGSWVRVEGYWIERGEAVEEAVPTSKYISTESVKQNLHNLARIVAARTLPVLLQGETSVGKTTLIQYLASLTKNYCVRINNHEHTDLQEYVGSYVADSEGKLVFKEGVLVEAMRKGHWIILDELNLAPTEVLEALNRVLDDNRELFITETQKVVKAHPRFMLFATQNPPGHYGGRKMLSRAFRNRFAELHFSEIPAAELEIILHRRCDVPETYCKKMVSSMLELQRHRRGSSLFAGKNSFMTLRDLFRWGERYQLADEKLKNMTYDWEQHLAEEGHLLLAGRARQAEEGVIIREVLEKNFLRRNTSGNSSRRVIRTIDTDRLFDLNENTSMVTRPILEFVMNTACPCFGHIVWTYPLRRLAVLVGKALQFDEPVLLVGETGCGKTTICELFAAMNAKKLHSVSCHMHSEGTDFLGGLRPVRHQSMDDEDENVSRLFEWVDGPLVKAMNEGSYFLADEISLADDSVLERLNSVLESERKLLLSEKGAADGEVEFITAATGFHFVATMNPGGDYGKRELSPALRNRFTEIWCSTFYAKVDLLEIAIHNLHEFVNSACVAKAMVDFIDWFQEQQMSKKLVFSIRDLLSWVRFVNVCVEKFLKNYIALDKQTIVPAAFVHGAYLVFLDGLHEGDIFVGNNATDLRSRSLGCLLQWAKKLSDCKITEYELGLLHTKFSFDIVVSDQKRFGISPFYIEKEAKDCVKDNFLLRAPTPCQNAQRLLRAMQLPRPILLEGPPGVGKTSIVAALANATGHRLVRINLSEQTDVSDLFGSDMPVEGASGGRFAWCDGPLLQALKRGSWVVFDEMNLASQSVLEGLNACLDHRGEIFVPELGRSFLVQHGKTKLFACQNPMQQGGARKGLPRSFLNRFTQVYMDNLTQEDLQHIALSVFPQLPDDLISKMVQFNTKLNQQVTSEGQWGHKGAPWEFNLRDVFRWAQVMRDNQCHGKWNPGEYVRLIYVDRFRTSSDKTQAMQLFRDVFGEEPYTGGRNVFLTDKVVQVGNAFLNRKGEEVSLGGGLRLLGSQLDVLESLAKCLQMNWLPILVGPASSGKTSVVHILAQLSGRKLRTITLNSASDAADLIGSFEQVDLERHLEDLEADVQRWFHQQEEKSGKSRRKRGRTCISIVSSSVSWSDRLARLGQLFEGGKFQVEDDTDPSSMFQKEGNQLVNRWKELKRRVKEASVNGRECMVGGQFEWVDSALVRAVAEGQWVLLDNVNFCSSAVLDRLNALLEPGGVLTLDERGAINGEIPIVPTHPEFRLIMTMDSRNGELSRAMRNRGVEIGMVDEEEGTGMDVLDMRQVLHSKGLVHPNLQTKLMDIHAHLSLDLSEWERPSMVNMYRAAEFYAHQVKICVDPVTAWEHACHDAYVLSESKSSTRQKLKERLDAALKSNIEFPSIHVADGPSALSAIPSVEVYSRTPLLTSILKRMLPFVAICKQITSSGETQLTSSSWNIFPVINSDEEMAESALQLCLNTMTKGEWLRDDELYFNNVIDTFFSKHAKNNKVVMELVQVYSMLKQNAKEQPVVQRLLQHNLKLVVQGCDELISANSVPLDQRWNPLLLEAVIQWQKQNQNSELSHIFSLCNRLQLFLEFSLHKYKEDCLKQLVPWTPKNFEKQMTCLWQMMMSVKMGHISVELLPDRRLVDIAAFVEAFDEILFHLFGSDISCDDSHLERVQMALRWRKRFLLFLSCNFKRGQFNTTITYLSLHWIWLKRYAFPVFMSEMNTRFSENFTAVVTKLDKFLSGNVHPLHELAERLRSMYGLPMPCSSGEQADNMARLNSLNEIVDLSSSTLSNRILSQRQKIVNLACDYEFRRKMSQQEINIAICFSETEAAKVEELEQYFEVQGLRKNSDNLLESSDMLTAKEDTVVSAVSDLELQTWPMLDRMNLSLLRRLLPLLLNASTTNVEVKQLLQQFNLQMLRLPTESPTKLAFYQLLSKRLGTDLNFARTFEHQLVLDYCCRSSCLMSSTNILEVCFLKLDDDNDDSERTIADSCFESDVSSVRKASCCLSHSASLSYLMAGLYAKACGNALIGKNLQYLSSELKLENFSEKLQQTNKMVTLAIHDGETLNPHLYNARTNECTMITHLMQNLMSSLETAQGVDLQTEGLVIGDIHNMQLDSEHLELNPETQALVSVACRTVAEMQDHLTIGSLGKSWVYVGLVQCCVFSPLGPVDPVEKTAFLTNYQQQELKDIERELKLHDWMSMVLTGRSIADTFAAALHPHVRRKLLKLKELENAWKIREERAVTRPVCLKYNLLANDMSNFFQTIGATNLIVKLMEGLLVETSARKLRKLLEKYESWRSSVRSFLRSISSSFSMYKDLWLAPLTSISQVAHGLSLLAFDAERRLGLNNLGFTEENMQDLLEGLMVYPSTLKTDDLVPHMEHLLSLFRSSGVKMVLTTSDADESHLHCLEQLICSYLLELQDVASVARNEQQRSLVFSSVLSIVRHFVVQWQNKETELRQKKEEDESTFQYRTRTCGESLTSEEEDEKEFRKLFPTYGEDMEEINFADVEDQQAHHASLGAMEIVAFVHSEVFSSSMASFWYRGTKGHRGTNHVKSFFLRYLVGARLLDKIVHLTDSSLNAKLLLGNLVLCGAFKEAMLPPEQQFFSPKDDAPYDFYHDPRVEEVVKCRSLLDDLRKRVNELMKEWPENPNLQQILKVVNRVLSFSVTSPLIKFVTGLEMVLTTAEEWQLNAHKGVSLAAELEVIVQLNVSWRKLELKCWSNCLQVIAYNADRASHRWWFHTYVLVESALKNEDDELGSKMSTQDFLKAMHQLMEASPLGEFVGRLRIILAFHCQLTYTRQNKGTSSLVLDNLINITWNCYCYYRQFQDGVEKKIMELRKPIEKEVKGFVRTAQWSDRNSWAIKQAIEKSHRTLHKHMKKFQNVLGTPAKSTFLDSQTRDGQTSFEFPCTKLFISPMEWTRSEISVDVAVDGRNFSKLFVRMKRVSKQIMNGAGCFSQIKLLDEYAGEIVQVTQEMAALQVNMGASKEKQIAEAKHFNHRKRQALATLFKSLTSKGLSFGKGLTFWKSGQLDELMQLPPLNFETILTGLETSSVDEHLRQSGDGISSYFYRIIARLAGLKSAMHLPHKDLGIGNINRISGFPSHLAELIQQQHNVLVRSLEAFVQIRLNMQSLSKLNKNDIVFRQRDIKKFMGEAVTLSNEYKLILEQLNVILMSLPPQSCRDQCAVWHSVELLEKFPVPFTDDPTWSEIQNCITAEIQKVTQVCAVLVPFTESTSNSVLIFYDNHDVDRLSESLDSLSCISRTSFDLVERIGGCISENSQFFRNLVESSARLQTLIENFGTWKESQMDEEPNSAIAATPTTESKCVRAVEKFVREMLLCLQALRSLDKSQKEKSDKVDEDEDISIVSLMITLVTHVSHLKLRNISRTQGRFLKYFANLLDQRSSLKLRQTAKNLVQNLYPLWDQFCLVVEFYLMEMTSLQRCVCKLNSILLGIFTELTQKGFCVPDEIADEVGGEGSTEFVDIENGGLGQGEGTKDVSDRIESEDQLEDAHMDGEERKEEDDQHDIKEEENGIEMSDDFEGRIHDPSAKEGDESEDDEDDDSDDEELDKQMGDVGQDGDKLDEKMWGSDSEDDDEDEDAKSDDGEHGPGDDACTETQLVANEDNKDKTNAKKEKEKESEQDRSEQESKEEEEINCFDERECDDSKPDPHQHDDSTRPEEAEPLDLPDDMDLDANELDGEENAEDVGDDDVGDPKETEENAEAPEDMADDDGVEKEVDGEKDANGEEQHQPEEEPMDIDQTKDELQNKTVSEEEAKPDDQEEAESGEDHVSKMDEEPTPGETSKQANSGQSETAQDQTEASANAAVKEMAASRENEDCNVQEKNNHSQVAGLNQDCDGKEEGSLVASYVDKIMDQSLQQSYRPRESNSKRTLGESGENVKKRLRTNEVEEQNAVEKDETASDVQQAELYEHVSEAGKGTERTRDAATLEEAAEQMATDQPTLDEESEKDVHMHEDSEVDDDDPAKLLESVKNKDFNRGRDRAGQKSAVATEEDQPVPTSTVGDTVETSKVKRSGEATFHTNLLNENESLTSNNLPSIEQLRVELEAQLSVWATKRSKQSDSVALWHQFETATTSLAQKLFEELRLVLQPSVASKLQGDFRTGKRLNMRKIVSYIASQYRKDKIWLRRTNPTKHNYQVMMVVDDSSSMADNQARELAFESVAVISKALTLLEAGELAVASFGETFELVHPFGQPFTTIAGGHILDRFTFQQCKTHIAKMLDKATDVMLASRSSVSSLGKAVQLLVIVSDGRDAETASVKEAVRRIRENHIFVVFIVLDKLSNENSIFDSRIAIYNEKNKFPEFKSYMDVFPFEFYIVLREISSLPEVLGNALRQWFELVIAQF